MHYKCLNPSCRTATGRVNLSVCWQCRAHGELREQFDEARAEVARLTAERDAIEAATIERCARVAQESAHEYVDRVLALESVDGHDGERGELRACAEACRCVEKKLRALPTGARAVWGTVYAGSGDCTLFEVPKLDPEPVAGTPVLVFIPKEPTP